MAIIEEDIKRQLRLESNGVEQPLSEAYLNGRPQKRRKVLSLLVAFFCENKFEIFEW